MAENKTIADLTPNETPDLTEAILEYETTEGSGGLTRRVTARNLMKTGWAYYADAAHTSGAPLSVVNARVKLLNNGSGATTNKSFLPHGVTDLWNTSTNKITPIEVGDAYMIRVEFKAKPNNNDAHMGLQLDIGNGSPENIVHNRIIFPKQQVEHSFSWSFPVFTLETFKTNGGEIYFDTTSGSFDIDVYDIAILVSRMFAAK